MPKRLTTALTTISRRDRAAIECTSLAALEDRSGIRQSLAATDREAVLNTAGRPADPD
jgi:hypothetical protein